MTGACLTAKTARAAATRPVIDRGAFTLVELLVVISVIGVLVAILMPVLGRARESARDNVCKSNLRQIGIGLMAHAESRGLLCSGAFDWRRDGCATEVGWVADLVNRGTKVGDMLCPANSVELSETYNDLLNLDPSFDACVDRLGSPAGIYPDGTPKINACRQIAGMAPGEPRRQIVEKLIFEKGFNTNYAAGWFLVRSGVRLDVNGNLKGEPGCPVSLEERTSTLGPLHTARIGGIAAASTSQVPLLGCAQAVNAAEGILSFDVGPYPAGSRLATSFSAGPVLNPTMQAPVFPPGTTYGGPAGWWAGWKKTLQDYRSFGPAHGRSANILFADGSVRSFADANGDGFLNNGFDPAATSLRIGYTDAVVELKANDFFSGWSLNPEQVKAEP
ncbi:MAG: DUF1559 domain-containing protein [Pirellulales bacterium]